METPDRIEPAFFEGAIPEKIADLSLELQAQASTLGAGLPKGSLSELAEFVRVMNCYYSNLIEGHNTKPKDIERALAGAELEESQRPLALEAKAHVIVQREIDALSMRDKLPNPTSAEFIAWVHRRFYEEMPGEFRSVTFEDGRTKPIVPGKFRTDREDDVQVGRHVPPSSPSVNAFMEHFTTRYAVAQKSAVNRIIAIAAAHHRLNYIHPFPDGNGRVSRLMSHAMAHKAGIGGDGLWAISRGLARGLKSKSEYKSMMDYADSPRKGALDGRGNLSQSALEEFTAWFLEVALDQIRFSKSVFALDTLEERYRSLVSSVTGDKRGADVVSAILKFGELDRGNIDVITKTSDRTARKTTSMLAEAGFIKSDGPKKPVRIAFPLDYREKLFPNLFGDIDVDVPKDAQQESRSVAGSFQIADKYTIADDPGLEFQTRLERLSQLQSSAKGADYVLLAAAQKVLRSYLPSEIDWRAVEDEVINESIGEKGCSRSEVIQTLRDFSLGVLTASDRDAVNERVHKAAPELVAKYNERFLAPPKR